jgi:hypothetical protein
MNNKQAKNKKKKTSNKHITNGVPVNQSIHPSLSYRFRIDDQYNHSEIDTTHDIDHFWL